MLSLKPVLSRGRSLRLLILLKRRTRPWLRSTASLYQRQLFIFLFPFFLCGHIFFGKISFTFAASVNCDIKCGPCSSDQDGACRERLSVVNVCLPGNVRSSPVFRSVFYSSVSIWSLHVRLFGFPSRTSGIPTVTWPLACFLVGTIWHTSINYKC